MGKAIGGAIGGGVFSTPLWIEHLQAMARDFIVLGVALLLLVRIVISVVELRQRLNGKTVNTDE